MSNMHEALRPICFLIGKWRSIKAKGYYPNVPEFEFCSELVFQSKGQPLLNYKATNWNPKDMSLMHLERGFLRIKPCDTLVAFMVAHNLGVTTIEEGHVQGYCVTLRTGEVGNNCFLHKPPVIEVARTFCYCPNSKHMEMIIYLATCKTPLTEHIRIKYKKVCS